MRITKISKKTSMRIPNPESVDFNILSSEGFSGFGMVKELAVWLHVMHWQLQMIDENIRLGTNITF